MKTTTKTFLNAFFFLLFPLWLLAQDFDIREINVSVDIHKEGFFDVQEIIAVHFNERRKGIYRDIPYKYKTSDGEKYVTKISNIRVKGHDQKVERDGKVLRIRIGNPNKYLSGDVTYTISYRVYNAFNYLEDRTEFYWNVTGPGWSTSIDKVSFKIALPDDLIIPDEDIAVFTGPEGSDQRSNNFTKQGRVVSGISSEILTPGSALTVAINLPPDYIQKATETTINNSFSEEQPSGNGGSIMLAIMALIGGVFGWMYKKTGRNKHTYQITEQYYPPAGMISAEVGTFYDYTANTRDLISLIPHWGNQGYIHISALENTDGKPDIYFKKLKMISSDAPAYEHTLFNGLFSGESQVFLDDLKNKYYSTLSEAQHQLKQSIMDPELYDTKAKKYFHGVFSIFAFIGLLIFGIVLMVLFNYISAGIISVFLAIVILVIRFLRPKLSDEGLELHNQLEGLKLFLENPDPDKITELNNSDPGYLDKMLPFAIAFGLDKTWNASVAKTNISHAPPWYVYHNDNSGRSPSYTEFSSSFDVKTINAVFQSAPASSGGGGGGGFSGGSSGSGFGGGGGGSW